MRKLVLHMITSIDGFVADRHGNVNPETQWDEEVQRFYLDLFTKADALVYGRRIFEQYVGHWKNVASGAISAANDLELRWTQRLVSMQKFVVSTKLNEGGTNTSIIKGDVANALSQIKQAGDGDILLMCGPALFNQLTKERLIDQYMLYVCPSVVGQGTHLFREIPDNIKLKFQRTKSFGSGMNLQYYAPIYE